MSEEPEYLYPRNTGRKAAFILVAADHGTMIVNRLDFLSDRPGYAVGVGCEILEHCCYEPKEVDLAIGLLTLRLEYNGPGVVAIDGGANVGVHTIEWARHMTHWGQVLAIEPQERIFYALAGNLAINNCRNAFALQLGLGDEDKMLTVHLPDYNKPGSYGGFELKPPLVGGMIATGQELNGGLSAELSPVKLIRLDSLGLERVDLVKLDLEGMELDALAGGEELIAECQPVLIVEHIKSGMERLNDWFRAHDYEAFQFQGNLVGAHRLDKCLDHIRHLHKSLLVEQADRDKWSVEWVKFGRKQEVAA